MDYTTLSRSDWLSLADRFYGRLYALCESLTPAEWDRHTAYLGWTARQVIAHEASAVPTNFREALDRALTDNPTPPPEFDTFMRNRRAVEARRDRTPTALLEEFRHQMDGFLGTYRCMSDADWLKPAWFYVGPINVRTVFAALLGDNVLHQRDLALVKGVWRGFDPEITPPLIDWFMRELRPAALRPERALDLNMTVLHRLSGVGGGEWTMHIANGVCSVERGSMDHPDVVLEADTEVLLAAGQGRAAPFVGALARLFEWVRGPEHPETVVAAATGMVSIGAARLTGRIKLSGDSAMSRRMVDLFWHFWQRSEQTTYNIRRGTVVQAAPTGPAGVAAEAGAAR